MNKKLLALFAMLLATVSVAVTTPGKSSLFIFARRPASYRLHLRLSSCIHLNLFNPTLSDASEEDEEAMASLDSSSDDLDLEDLDPYDEDASEDGTRRSLRGDRRAYVNRNNNRNRKRNNNRNRNTKRANRIPDTSPYMLPPVSSGGQLPYCPNGSLHFTGMGQCIASQTPLGCVPICPSGTIGWAAGTGQCIVW